MFRCAYAMFNFKDASTRGCSMRDNPWGRIIINTCIIYRNLFRKSLNTGTFPCKHPRM